MMAYRHLLATLYWLTPFLAIEIQHMATQARRTGHDQTWKLFEKRRVGLRIRATDAGEEWSVTYAREGADLTASEIEQFKVECGIPPGATRIPEHGQKRHTVREQSKTVETKDKQHVVVPVERDVELHYVAWRFVKPREEVSHG